MKRTISVFLVIALAIASVFASGASEDEGRSLDVWYALSGTSGEAFMSIVEDFNALDTGITINASYSGGYNDTATKITAALANGSTPDVLIGGQVTYSGAYGNFYVADRAEADPEFDYDDVFPGLWEYGIYNGRNCNIPFNISTNMMFYNRQLVEEAGLDLEADPPQTWDDFIEVCKVLRDYYEDRPNFIPFVVSDEDWLSNTQIMQCGNEVIAHNDDYSLKTAAWGVPECAKVAKWWQDMVKEGLMDMSMNQNGSNVFLGGNAAFFAGSSTTIIEWSEAMGGQARRDRDADIRCQGGRHGRKLCDDLPQRRRAEERRCLDVRQVHHQQRCEREVRGHERLSADQGILRRLADHQGLHRLKPCIRDRVQAALLCPCIHEHRRLCRQVQRAGTLQDCGHRRPFLRPAPGDAGVGTAL